MIKLQESQKFWNKKLQLILNKGLSTIYKHDNGLIKKLLILFALRSGIERFIAL